MSEIDLVSVLPPHSSGLEAGIETGGTIPVRQEVPATWNVETCPVELLPWLGHALSVDTWSDTWQETKKRAVIRASIDVHRQKGTLYAVQRAINALGFTARVVEWHRAETPGDPFTYQLVFDQREVPALLSDIQLAIRTVDLVKPVRAHMSDVRIRINALAGPNTANFSKSGDVVTVSPRFDPDADLPDRVVTYNGIPLTVGGEYLSFVIEEVLPEGAVLHNGEPVTFDGEYVIHTEE